LPTFKCYRIQPTNSLGPVDSPSAAAQYPRRRFDSLGNHFSLERCGQPDNTLQNGQVIWIEEHVTHKALGELEKHHAQALEVGE
jgi:hypothetical protein